MATKLTTENVLSAISNVKDPALNKGVVSESLIQDIEINGSVVKMTLVLISPGHPFEEQMKEELKSAILDLDGISDVEIKTVVDVPADAKVQSGDGDKIKNVIAVASGKGG